MKKNRLIIQFAGMLLLVPAMISAQQQTEKKLGGKWTCHS